jgi:adenylyl-sulfate kinase
MTKTYWLTGLSGAGKTTIANAASAQLAKAGTPTFVVDGDMLRSGLCSDLGFTQADRTENIRRAAELCKLLNAAGITVFASLISPLATDREFAKQIIGSSFIEVYISTSLEVCMERDVKGLYAKAKAGIIPNFTGLTAPYEFPISPDLAIDTAIIALPDAVDLLLSQ